MIDSYNLSAIICCAHWESVLEHTRHESDVQNYKSIMMARARLGLCLIATITYLYSFFLCLLTQSNTIITPGTRECKF